MGEAARLYCTSARAATTCSPLHAARPGPASLTTTSLTHSSLSFTAIGRVCERCDGKCVVCDSFVRPQTLVRICDECNYGSNAGRCCVCGAAGVADAYYCQECTLLEKDVSV